MRAVLGTFRIWLMFSPDLPSTQPTCAPTSRSSFASLPTSPHTPAAGANRLLCSCKCQITF